MPLVLATTTNPGSAYWVDSSTFGIPGWSVNGSFDFYPDTDNAQTLGLFDQRVERFFGRGMLLRGGTGTILDPTPGADNSSLGILQIGVGPHNVGIDGTGIVNGRLQGNPGYLYQSGFANTTNANLEISGGTATVVNRGDGGLVFGHVISSYAATLELGSSASGGLVGGYVRDMVTSNGAVGIFSSAPAAVAHGSIGAIEAGVSQGWEYGSIIATSVGSRASGVIRRPSALPDFRYGYIQSTGTGARAHGVVQPGGTISSTGVATTAFGVATYGVIRATLGGAIAGGYVSGIDSTYNSAIQSTANGALAHGMALHGVAYGATITANGRGSWAGGFAYGGVATPGYYGHIYADADGAIAFGYSVNGALIQASGLGSGAFGFADSPYDPIAASGDGSFQFGQGTNTVDLSLQVGGYDSATGYNFGIRLIGSGVAGNRNGDIWVDSAGDVFIRTGGVSKNITSLT